MAHPEHQIWCKQIKSLYPQYFINKKVIDIGSLDINGNNRGLFTTCEYIGVDVVKGKNVDVVSIAHELDFKDETFDVVLSTNALEHDMYYPFTIKKMFNLTKPNGLLFFTAAHSWKEHGTIKNAKNASGTTQMGKAWANYYKNITQDDIEIVLDKNQFKESTLEIHLNDIRFWGVKNER